MQTEITKSFVEFQSQTRLLELATEIAETKNLSKTKKEQVLATKIRIFLKALQYSDYLTKSQIDNLTYILVDLSDANAIPYAPVVTSVTAPSILVGISGRQGIQGEQGNEGGGVPFSYEDITIDTVVDSFAVSESRGVEYTINLYDDAASAMRTMRIQGGWNVDGSVYGDDGGIGQTIQGDCSGISVSIIVTGSTVQLFASVTSGTWNISGTRKYVPNNGNGITTPTTLAEGKIWVGNASGTPTAVTPSGDATITTAGVVAIASGVIVNADISASAAIAVSKLATLTASRAVVTNSSGVLTVSDVTSTEVGYLDGVTSNIQTQLDSKLSAATGAISTVVSTNLTASRALISNPSGKIAVSAVTSTELAVLDGITATTTELNYVDGVTSAIQTQLNGKASTTQGSWTTITLNSGDGYTAGSRTPQYRIDSLGQVHLRGIISIGGSPPSGDHAVSGAAAAPVPNQRQDFLCLNSSLSSSKTFYIDTNGTLRADTTVLSWGGTALLDGLSYWTD